jgi:KipI family sensor histidine kinase inhibitor
VPAICYVVLPVAVSPDRSASIRLRAYERPPEKQRSMSSELHWDESADLVWRRYGEHGILVEFASSLETLDAYRRCRMGTFDECVPGAQTIYFESTLYSAADLILQVQALLAIAPAVADIGKIRTHTIMVRYDGPDLENVAAITGFSVEEVIHRHSAPDYTVAFLGFSRSFAYLAGLDPEILVPRLAIPRTVVPAGSVGMAAGYTGIYPMSSPGGWQLLGRTDADMFDASLDPPSALATGDLVRFVRVMP